MPYSDRDRLGSYDRGLRIEPLGDIGYFNFVDASWLGFFDVYILPQIASRMVVDTRIVEVNHSGRSIRLTDAGGHVRHFDRIVVTVPLSVLRDGGLRFVPALPSSKTESLFASEAYTRHGDWGGVDDAARAARDAVARLVESLR